MKVDKFVSYFDDVGCYICNAPEVAIDPTSEWDWLTEEDKLIITDQKGLPCSGLGNIGNWCSKCHYGKYELSLP